jgi:hypothetical protein
LRQSPPREARRLAAATELAPNRPVIIVEKYRSLLRLAMEARDMGTLLAKNSEVKDVAGFLFPPPDAAEAERTGGGQGGEDRFRAYLESSARLYRSLAASAGFNLEELAARGD